MLNLKGFICFITGLLVMSHISAQENAMREENQVCLNCHSKQTYSFFNDWSGQEEKRLMNPHLVIDSVMFMNGVHQTFACTDCHSMDYETYPHMHELKLEPMATCLDCHGGDPHYEQYQFEKIDEEFQKSVHFERAGDLFTCSKCHDQHYYQNAARTSSTVGEIVRVGNQMCLTCHSNAAQYSLSTNAEFHNLNVVHEWLPNQELHFRSVRCIDCHAEYNQDLMVSHNIQPKENAVKKCAECHSANTMLQATLYRYENIQAREDQGFFSSIQSNQAYIIGANQVPLFKYITIGIIALMVVGISVHIAFRVILKK